MNIASIEVLKCKNHFDMYFKHQMGYLEANFEDMVAELDYLMSNRKILNLPET